VHNSKELWTLPNLVELRRRTGTRFYGFGTGKETFGEFASFLAFERAS